MDIFMHRGQAFDPQIHYQQAKSSLHSTSDLSENTVMGASSIGLFYLCYHYIFWSIYSYINKMKEKIVPQHKIYDNSKHKLTATYSNTIQLHKKGSINKVLKQQTFMYLCVLKWCKGNTCSWK